MSFSSRPLSSLSSFFSFFLRSIMILRGRRRTLSLSLSFVLGVSIAPLLSGCGDSPPPESFPAPDYSYLPRLNLSVAHLDIIDQTIGQNEGGDLAGKNPTPPADALRLMAEQRLNATGTGNSQGQFIITQSNITSEDSRVMTGNFSVQLRLDDPAQNHHGSITASVNRTTTATDGESQAHHLYALTQTMMDAMNVELEYQIRKNMGSWLTDATGSPLNSTVQSQNLAGSPPGPNTLSPARSMAVPSPTGETLPSGAVSSDNALTFSSPARSSSPQAGDKAASPDKIYSPQPGVLHLP